MEIGDRYNHWVVIDYPFKVIKPSGEIYLKVPCQCICGKTRDINKYSLTSGRSKSCGCETYGTHGKSYTRLYECWVNMKQRARRRQVKGEQCSVCDEWLTYEGFELWAINNGYEDGLELLRGTEDSPDTGDYSPSNARWGTHRQNYLDYLLAREKRDSLHLNVMS